MPKKTKSQAMISHSLDGSVFHQREEDGYINGTEFCKANGKRIGDFLDLPSTQRYIDFLTTRFSGSINPVFTKEGKGGGTWLHPKLAIHLGQWISVEMMDLVSDIVLGWMSGETKAKKPIKPIRSPERQKATDATKSLNDVIMEKLCQEPQHIFIHVENSLHAGITGMSATHHKKVTGGSNSVDLINNIEQNIYSCAKNMLLEKLLTHEDSSLTRSQIRDLAIDVRAFCENLVGNLENQGYLNNNRYLPLLPETKRKMHSLH